MLFYFFVLNFSYLNILLWNSYGNQIAIFFYFYPKFQFFCWNSYTNPIANFFIKIILNYSYQGFYFGIHIEIKFLILFLIPKSRYFCWNSYTNQKNILNCIFFRNFTQEFVSKSICYFYFVFYSKFQLFFVGIRKKKK